MQRRDLFPVLGVAAVAGPLHAQHEHHKVPRLAAGNYKLQSFSEAQDAVLDRLADILIPADAEAGGAHEARVSKYLDLIVHYGTPQLKQRFERGLAAVESEAKSRFQKSFGELSLEQQTQIMTRMAENEEAPQTELERFFALLKGNVVEGYRLSHVGQTQWLKYQPHPAGLYPEEALAVEVR